MKEIQITITVRIPEESNIGKYIVPRSNFDDVYVYGVPCMILTDPYVHKDKKVYDVCSMLTGIKYTIPVGYTDMFDTLEEANEHADVRGVNKPTEENIIGMKYVVHDNSFIRERGNFYKQEHYDLISKECVVVSKPYSDSTYDTAFIRSHGDKTYKFVDVAYCGRVYRVLFQEWSLMDPDLIIMIRL